MTMIAPLQPLSVPLQQVRLIEASAGTGKTWTIAALYLRLVLGRHEQATPLLPPQILVLTFTKAATAELRERIRVRLAEAAAAFRDQLAPDDYLRELIHQYPEPDQRAVAARQLELAAQWMDEAAVHTIHGWCQRMLAQHAFDSGHPFVQDISTDESELIAEAVRDYWRQHFFALDQADAQQISALWSGPASLQKDVSQLLRLPADQLRLDGQPLSLMDDIAELLSRHFARLRDAVRVARQSWHTHAAELTALLHEAIQAKALNGKSYTATRLDSDLSELAAWATGGTQPSRDVVERVSQAKLDKSTNKNRTTPTHPTFRVMDELMDALDNTLSPRPMILAHAVPWIAARLEAAKQRLAQMGYDDMLKRLDQALHGISGERLAQTIATQYPVVLIDEFQDTDPLQWRIFERIHAARPQTGLLLIGDPKQAIYGFRGADIHTYLHARRQAQAPTWTLDTNYRSTEALVSAVNHLFEHAQTHPLGAFAFGKGANALPFQPVRAHGRKEQLVLRGKPLTALQLGLAAGTEPISKADYRSHMAEHAAAWLVDLLDAAQLGLCGFVAGSDPLQPLAPADIAILVRDRREAACMRHALQARGLASVYLSDRDSVYASPQAADLLLWLKACADPGSDRAMRAALATGTMAQDYAALEQLNRDEAFWEAMTERFRQLHEHWRKHGVLSMLHEWLHLFDLPAQLLSQRRQDERALTNILHVAELLQHAATTLDGEHALLRYLATQITQAAEAPGQPADEKIVRLESEAGLIQVVTIHKSKGLEYPLVMLPFVCAMRETKLHDNLAIHDEHGQVTLDLRSSEALRERADRERLQEDLRLFYVAMTRARHACWLGVADLKDGRKKASGLHKSAFGYVVNGEEAFRDGDLAARLATVVRSQSDIQINVLAGDAAHERFQPALNKPTVEPARTYHGTPVAPWWIASYSALRTVADETVARPSAPETAQQETLVEALNAPSINYQATPSILGIHAFPRGADAGTFLHDVLEWAADKGFAAAVRDTQGAHDLVMRRCQRHGWQVFAESVLAWLPTFLATPLPLPGGNHTCLADADAYRAELEFWFEANQVDTLALDRLITAQTLDARPRPALQPDHLNGMLKGFIDLVMEHDGRFYIIDYKSNWLGPDEQSYTVQAMDASIRHSRYDLQYAIYTLALHRQLRARLPGYDYDTHVGGALYLYLRGVDESGHGVHRERLPFTLVDALDHLFAGGASTDVA